MEHAHRAITEYLDRGRPRLFGATVADIYKLWSDTHYRNVTEKTANCFRSTWKHFAPIAGMKMTDIRTAHIQQLVNDHPGAGVSRGIKLLARALCRCAIENDLIAKNYADFVKLPKTEKSEKIIFSAEQIRELWENSENKNIRVILIMIYMGFRIGEIAGLRVRDIYPDEGYVICGEKTEAGRDRIIPFPPQIPEIKQFFAEMAAGAGADGRLFPFTEHTFRTNVFYEPLIALGMVDAHIDEKRRVIFRGEHHLTPHSTRHTFATLSVEAGIRPEHLQKIIGHAKFATTADIYVHLTREMLTEEMGKLCVNLPLDKPDKGKPPDNCA